MAVTCPSLVTAIMLEETKTLTPLQNFRLVCKYWNTLAQNAIKKKAIVRLIETDDSRFTAFCSAVCKENLEPPSFMTFELTFQSFCEPEFLRFALNSSATIRRLRVLHLHENSLFRAQIFCMLLATKGQYVEELELKTESTGTDLSPSIAFMPRLSFVTVCSIEDDSTVCQNKLMLSQILEATNCTKVQIRCTDEQLAGSLIESLNDGRLKELTIETYTFSEGTWASLLSKRLSCLVSLTIILHQEPFRHEEKMSALVSRLAAHIRSIESNVHFLVPCPRLRRISLVENSGLAGVTASSFPILKNVNLSCTDGFWSCLCQPCETHPGVSSLSIDSHFAYTSKCFTEIDLLRFLRSLKNHFPNVQSLLMVCCGSGGIAVDVVYQVFPSLQHLSVNSSDGSVAEVGILSQKLNQHSNTGWKLEDIISLSGSSGFTELKTLSFGNLVEIDSVFSLERLLHIPSLQHISFYWSFGLDPLRVGKSLARVRGASIRGLRRSSAAHILETYENIYCYYCKEPLDYNVDLYLQRNNQIEI